MAKATLKQMTLLSPLPDLFTLANGQRVRNAEDWEIRRAEMMDLAVGLQYGGMPPQPEFLDVEALTAPTVSVPTASTPDGGKRRSPS